MLYYYIIYYITLYGLRCTLLTMLMTYLTHLPNLTFYMHLDVIQTRAWIQSRIYEPRSSFDEMQLERNV